MFRTGTFYLSRLVKTIPVFNPLFAIIPSSPLATAFSRSKRMPL